MKKTLITAITATLMAMMPAATHAQDDMEYRMEIGVGGGMAGYLGDFNGNLTKDLQPMAAVVARYNFDTYMGLKANVAYAKMKGSSADVKTYYPELAATPYEFNNTLVDASLTFEYNFIPYGTGKEYRGAQRLAPFVFGGLGATYVNTKSGNKKNVFSANVPIGLGLKYKVGDRTNIGLEWAMHFSLSDEIDGKKDPYSIKSSGAFKNTDCYHTLMLTFSYSFMTKCRVCHNQDED